MKNSSFSKIPLLIYGTGGISIEVCSLIEEVNRYNYNSIYQIVGYIEKDIDSIGKKVGHYQIVASDDTLETFLKHYNLIGLIIPLGSPQIKRKIYTNLKKFKNIYFPNVIHPSATLDGNIELGVGNIITAGCRFTTQISIGNFNLFNLNVTIGHEVIVGDFCIINPGTTISGGVVLQDAILVGTGVNILQYIKVENDAILGAGALVNKNVSSGLKVMGIPAKPNQ